MKSIYVIGSGYSKINSMRKALQPYEGASDVAAKKINIYIILNEKKKTKKTLIEHLHNGPVPLATMLSATKTLD